MLRFLSVAGLLACLPLITAAQAGTPVGAYHGAPAPLLAAGIPAFVALGGGAVFTRLLRRMRRGGADGVATERSPTEGPAR